MQALQQAGQARLRHQPPGAVVSAHCVHADVRQRRPHVLCQQGHDVLLQRAARVSGQRGPVVRPVLPADVVELGGGSPRSLPVYPSPQRFEVGLTLRGSLVSRTKVRVLPVLSRVLLDEVVLAKRSHDRLVVPLESAEVLCRGVRLDELVPFAQPLKWKLAEERVVHQVETHATRAPAVYTHNFKASIFASNPLSFRIPAPHDVAAREKRGKWENLGEWRQVTCATSIDGGGVGDEHRFVTMTTVFLFPG